MPNQQALSTVSASSPQLPTPCTITPALLKQHSITPDEYTRLQAALGRTPSLTELGIFSVMWSEHCSYKSSRVHLKRLPTKGTRTSGPGSVVQGPGENAGIIDVGDGWACAFKIESHNHPSSIEPYQGAATGVGGILRDIFTMGARPLAIMDSLRFGPLAPSDAPAATLSSPPWLSSRSEAEGSASPDAAPSPDHTDYNKNHQVANGVVHGVAGYGNCFGVPNLGGETRFEPCYSGNPLLNAFALGLVRHDEIFYAKATGVGNPVFYVGAKTGRDGIHGATMASEEFTEGSEQKRPNVQMGDPFLEKLLLEACLEAMKTGAVLGIQDMGAAGLTCSTCEMGARGELGVSIELDLVPQRETGMSSYEIMLSESQERMLLVAQKGREHEVLEVFAKWGLDCAEVGIVTADDIMRVHHHGELVAEIPNKALTDDAPVYNRPVGTWTPPVPRDPPDWVLKELQKPRDYTADLLKLLASPNICDKRYIYEQYDSMVQTNTVQGPGFEAGVIRIKGTGNQSNPAPTSRHPERSEGPREVSPATTVRPLSNTGPTTLDPIAVDHSISGKLLNLVAGSTPKGEANAFPHSANTLSSEETSPVKGTASPVPSAILPESGASAPEGAADFINSAAVAATGPGGLDPTAVDHSILGKLTSLVADSTPEGHATALTGNQDAANPVVAPDRSHDLSNVAPERGIAMALAGNGRWCYLNPKLGAMHAVAEAARKVACTGATPVAATNCLNFGNPEKPEIMAQLSLAIDGIAEACTALNTPITGGNVSLYNETRGEGIYPTPVIGVVGLLEDVTKAVPNSFQSVGDDILLIYSNDSPIVNWVSGMEEPAASKELSSAMSELGSSAYASQCLGQIWGQPPRLDLSSESKIHQLLRKLADLTLIKSACDVSDGGWAVAVVRASLTNDIGASVEKLGTPFMDSPEDLFIEHSSVILVSCAPETSSQVEKMVYAGGLNVWKFGRTIVDKVQLAIEGGLVVDARIADLRAAYSSTLESQLAAEVVTA